MNHALGLVSLDAMEAGRLWFLALWRSPLGAVALYSAFLVHIAMALWSIYRRRTWRMPAWEATQLALGLTIPVLLARHVVGTRMANLLYGQVDPYSRVALVFWQFRPDLGLRQSLVLLVAWRTGASHPFGCASCVVSAREAAAVRDRGPLPVLALLGFVNAGAPPAALRASREDGAPAPADDRPRPGGRARGRSSGRSISRSSARSARAARARGPPRLEHPGGRIKISYPDGREVVVPEGSTFSRRAGSRADLPRVGVRRARALLECRVHVVAGLKAIPRPERRRAARPRARGRAARRTAAASHARGAM